MGKVINVFRNVFYLIRKNVTVDFLPIYYENCFNLVLFRLLIESNKEWFQFILVIFNVSLTIFYSK